MLLGRMANARCNRRHGGLITVSYQSSLVGVTSAYIAKPSENHLRAPARAESLRCLLAAAMYSFYTKFLEIALCYPAGRIIPSTEAGWGRIRLSR
jgi:hypothetical protein